MSDNFKLNLLTLSSHGPMHDQPKLTIPALPENTFDIPKDEFSKQSMYISFQ